MSRQSIMAEVLAERERQDRMFGGESHDDTHSATDWVGIIVRHLGLAMDDGRPADVCLMNDHCSGHDPVRYRRQLVRVAAIAVAALETFDRKLAQAESERAQSWAAPEAQDVRGEAEAGKLWDAVPVPTTGERSAGYISREGEEIGLRPKSGQ